MLYQTKVIDLYEHFDEGLEEASALIRAGDVVAFPTETVYGLGADALRPEAIRMIFAAKGRPQDNPLIAHVGSIDHAEELAYVTEEAEALMCAFWPGPLTVVLKKRDIVPYAVTAGLSTVAVRMPDNEAALELIYQSGTAIAAPSANVSGRPSPTRAEHVLADLGGKIPLILDGGETDVGLESTVVALGDVPTILRPGAITPAMIRDVLGEVDVDWGVLHPIEDDGRAAPSPGMKHRHYAPNARVLLVDGEMRPMAERIGELYDAERAAGNKCLIFATKQTQAFYNGKDCVIMGDRDDLMTVCNTLFGLLRQADADGYDVVLVEALGPHGLGLACMNRLLRAADFELIEV